MQNEVLYCPECAQAWVARNTPDDSEAVVRVDCEICGCNYPLEVGRHIADNVARVERYFADVADALERQPFGMASSCER